MDKDIDKIIARALSEDTAQNDITTAALFSKAAQSKACIIAKEEGVICGLLIGKRIFQKLDKNITFQAHVKEGQQVKKGVKLATIKGKTRALLTGERVVLNFVGYLSGIASQTRKYVQAIKSTKAQILDTRKTTPSLRVLEKYAVRCGGGYNHRHNLSEMAMIKDNHWAAGVSITDAVRKIRQKTRKKIEVEVDDFKQLQQALDANADIILLDNMTIAQIKKAVMLVKKAKVKNKPLLEASGGINLKTVRAIAQTGVNRISIGALTHTHKALNVSMELSNT